MFEPYYDLLPPHWRYDQYNDVYVNDLTEEETREHPINIFMKSRKQVLNLPQDDNIAIEIERILYEREMEREMEREKAARNTNTNTQVNTDPDSEPVPTEESSPTADIANEPFTATEASNQFTEEANNTMSADQAGTATPELDLPTGKYYEFHCQWSERDLFGKVNLYGLTLRFYVEQQRTLIKFDGLVGEWVYSVIKGPYGPMEHMDFFIGARVNVFGRHLTISSASGSAIRWIEKERKRLEKQQEYFREKIMAVGQVPCIKGKDATIVRHITRATDNLPGHTDLRKLLQCNARLGSQLAALGLSEQL